MTSWQFWAETLERAGKTFAQSLLALLGAGAFDLLDAPWLQSAAAAGMAAVLSVLSSVASSGVGSTASPSLVTPVAPATATTDGASWNRPGRHAAP